MSKARVEEKYVQDNARGMKIQLEMQIDLNRELESRLEQALTGWKQEKERAFEYSQKITELKIPITEYQHQISQLTRDNIKLENRLKLYDSLPLPEEIRTRFEDMEDDRYKMKNIINELTTHLKITTDELKNYMEKTSRLDIELNHVRNSNEILTKDLEEMRVRFENILEELKNVQLRNKSLRESCTVFEIENRDLLDNEQRLKLQIYNHNMGNDPIAIAEKRNEDVKETKSDIDTETVLIQDINSVLENNGNSHIHIATELQTASPIDHLPESEVHGASRDEVDEDAAEAARIQDRLAKSKVQRLVDSPQPAELLSVLCENIHNESMVWRCMRALRSLLIQSDTFKQLCCDKLLDYTVMQCMKEHDLSDVVQTQGLRILAALSYSNDKLRRRAGESGIMRLLVNTMQTHAKSEDVQLYAFNAITNLTNNSFENRMRFSESGGIEAMVSVLEMYSDVPKLQKQGCWAILTIAAEDRLSLMIVDRGIPAVLANALVNHRTDAGIQQFACLAFSNLALAGKEVRSKLRNSGILELFRITIEEFKDEADVVNAARKAIQSLHEEE